MTGLRGAQTAEAAAFYRRAIEAVPGHAEAHCNLGVILRSHGKLEEAAACYQRSLQAAPPAAQSLILVNLAVVLSELGTKLKLEVSHVVNRDETSSLASSFRLVSHITKPSGTCWGAQHSESSTPFHIS